MPENRYQKFLILFLALFFICAAKSWAYIPDVGPGVCVSSEGCYDEAPSSSSSSSYAYSSSDDSDDSYSGYGGGYYNSYDAMAMNTAMGLMGSFMNSVAEGMARQQAYQAQVAEEQRVQAEIAWQEQMRLLAQKKEDQIKLRDEYRDKLTTSSVAVKAGIGRILNMFGGSIPSDSGGLKLENFDWDGRGGGGLRDSASGIGTVPLQIMRDDFVDSNVVDLRDKTELAVDPAQVKGSAPSVTERIEGSIQTESAAAMEQKVAEAETRNPTPAASGNTSSFGVVDQEQMKGDTPSIPLEADNATSPIQTESARAMESRIQESSSPRSDSVSLVIAEDGEPISIPYEPPSSENPVQAGGIPPSGIVDPAQMKGDTPAIPAADTVDSLKRAEAIREGVRMAGIREEVAQVQEEKQQVYGAFTAGQNSAPHFDPTQVEERLKTDPGFAHAMDAAKKGWEQAEKEYAEGRTPSGDSFDPNDADSQSLFDLVLGTPSGSWPGPLNEEREKIDAVYKIWQKNESSPESGKAYLSGETPEMKRDLQVLIAEDMRLAHLEARKSEDPSSGGGS